MLHSSTHYDPLERLACFQITNIVVANDSANATLAMGGSPIMASAEQEVGDLSKAISGLLINFG